MRLVEPLSSYPDRDEFQIGRVLVVVKYDQARARAEQVSEAGERLHFFEADILSVEALVEKAVSSTYPATVIGIHIEPDGTASYDCTFFKGEHEDEFFGVHRATNGRLTFNRT